jgi:hypothetical protein
MEHFYSNLIVVGNDLIQVIAVIVIVLAYEGLRFIVREVF